VIFDSKSEHGSIDDFSERRTLIRGGESKFQLLGRRGELGAKVFVVEFSSIWSVVSSDNEGEDFLE